MITKCNNSQCRATLRIPEQGAEAHLRCPQCGKVFTIFGGTSFVIFDLETTGLSPDCCEIIQIAATRFRDGESVSGESFFSFCRPSQRIPQFISAVEDDESGHNPDIFQSRKTGRVGRPALEIKAFGGFPFAPAPASPT